MDGAGLQLSKDLTRSGIELMAKVDETLEGFKPNLLTAEMSDMELRKHVAAQDTNMIGRLDKIEAELQSAIDKLDINLREHTQQAVQETAGGLADAMERLHIVETARGMTSSRLSSPTAPISASTSAASPAHGNRFELSSLKMRISDFESRMTLSETSISELG